VFLLRRPRRWEIVVFRLLGKVFVKRLIGLPGEWISIRDGRVLVDGTPLADNYVPASYLDHDNDPSTYVPPGHYYVLGDHRESSNDSRVWGTVDRRFIYGKAVFIYWPLDQAGALQ